MRRVPMLVVALLCAGALLSACGDEVAEETTGLPPEAGVAPTRGQALDVLRDFLDALESRDHDAALGFLLPSAVKDKAKARKRLAGLVKKGEISRAGLAILGQRARYGPLAEIFPDEGGSWAARAGVDADKCHAFRDGEAAVVLYWGDEVVRLLRVDDVGRLK